MCLSLKQKENVKMDAIILRNEELPSHIGMSRNIQITAQIFNNGFSKDPSKFNNDWRNRTAARKHVAQLRKERTAAYEMARKADLNNVVEENPVDEDESLWEEESARYNPPRRVYKNRIAKKRPTRAEKDEAYAAWAVEAE